MKHIFTSIAILVFSLGLLAQNAELGNSVSPALQLPDIVSANCDCQEEKLIVNEHTLEGYTDKSSYHPGDIIKLYVHSLSKKVSVSFSKEGISSESIKKVNRICAKKQNYTSCSFKNGCGWEPSLYFKLDDSLSSGFYSLKVYSKTLSYMIPFVISPLPSSENRVLVIASTNTWQAYNDWGGASFYKFNNDNPCGIRFATKLSFLRPNNLNLLQSTALGHTYLAEMELVKWLQEQKYDFDIASDDDVHQDSTLLERYKVVIVSTHGEYWTKNMYDQIETYVNNGGSVMSLGANQIYWKVIRSADKIECMKFGEQHSLIDEKGGRWRDFSRPESALLGVEYSTPGISTYASYQVINPTHWVFNGTNLQVGDTIGNSSSTGSNFTGASGHETDKMTSFSPSNTVLLAKGFNPSKIGDNDYGAGGAAMTIYEHPAGGGVFAAGSISYNGALSIDKKVALITKNVLDNFINR